MATRNFANVDWNRWLEATHFRPIQFDYIPTPRPARGGSGSAVSSFPFSAWRTAYNTIQMNPGEIWMGSQVSIPWASISGATETPAVSNTDTCVWLVIEQLLPETANGPQGAYPAYAWMHVGPRSYGSPVGVAMEGFLSESERTHQVVVPLVETVWTDIADEGEDPIWAIDRVWNLHPGYVHIPRAAG